MMLDFHATRSLCQLPEWQAFGLSSSQELAITINSCDGSNTNIVFGIFCCHSEAKILTIDKLLFIITINIVLNHYLVMRHGSLQPLFSQGWPMMAQPLTSPGVSYQALSPFDSLWSLWSSMSFALGCVGEAGTRTGAGRSLLVEGAEQLMMLIVLDAVFFGDFLCPLFVCYVLHWLATLLVQDRPGKTGSRLKSLLFRVPANNRSCDSLAKFLRSLGEARPPLRRVFPPLRFSHCGDCA